MTKQRTLRILIMTLNLIIIGSFFLPYRVVSQLGSSYNGFYQVTDYVELESGFKLVLPVLSLVFSIPINILIFTSKQRIGRIVNIVLSIIFVFFAGFCFFLTSLDFFIAAKPGFGVYLLVFCSLSMAILTIVHFRSPTTQVKSKEILDDF